MTSVVTICNMALGRIHADQISSLGEGTVPASNCNLYYAPSRDFVLADFWWNFAGKTAALAELSATPIEWACSYAYPSDALEIRYLVPNSRLRQNQDATEYEIATDSSGIKVIYTNLSDAYAKYTFRQTNVNEFSPHFVTALSWYLAAEVAIPIAGATKGRQLRNDALAGYRETMASAIAVNANEEYPGEDRLPEAIRAHQ